MFKSLLIIASAILASVSGQNPNATITSCGGSIKWTSLTINPIAPVAGDTVIVNATGVVSIFKRKHNINELKH